MPRGLGGEALGLVDVDGVGEADVVELAGVHAYLAWWALAGRDRDPIVLAAGVDDRASDPVLDSFLAGRIELSGEDHLVAACEAVGLAGKLDAVCPELACLGAAFLGHRVHLIALDVGGVGDHHGLSVGHVSAALVPVVDHRLGGLGARVVDVQAVVGLVLRERRAWFAVSDLLPCLALPRVVGAVDFGQLGGGDAALDLFEQAARSDRGELRGVACQQQLAFSLAGELHQPRETVAVGHAGLVHHHDRV